MAKKAKKILLIQPHSDDVLFSASHVILTVPEVCEVLTVENNPKRVKEDEALYGFLGIPYSHLTVDFDDQSYYEYHKKYKEVTPTDSFEHLTNVFGADTLNAITEQFSEWMIAWMKKNPGAEIYAPWGVGHPFHMFVRTLCETVVSASQLRFYREFPHSYKRRSKVQVEKQQQDYNLKTSYDIGELADVKWGLAKKFYRSQSGLLFFEQGYIAKNLPEEVYTLDV